MREYSFAIWRQHKDGWVLWDNVIIRAKNKFEAIIKVAALPKENEKILPNFEV